MRFAWIVMGVWLCVPAFAFDLGVVAGPTLSKMNFRSPDGTDGSTAEKHKLGFAGGISASFPIGGIFSVQPEFLYVQKGLRMEWRSIRVDYKFSYWELPVLMKATWPLGAVSPYLVLGPSVSRSQKAVFRFSSGGRTEEISVDELRKTEISAMGGAGAGWNVSDAVTLTFDVRYLWGFSDLSKDSAAGEKFTNRTWLFLAGARFPI